ncbi:MAG: SWIM zinc finger family protein [Bacteroidota bacterium]
MAILLRQLEQNVPEDALVLAEELLEQKAVKELQLVDSKLWIAQVLTYEVELKSTSQKLQAYTCECPRFQEEGICEHIVATAMVLRRQFAAEKAKKQAARTKTTTTEKKLTTKSILQQLSPDELRQFIQEYASHDRNFALALKARFVGQVESSDDKAKYLQLLDDAIKSARKKDRSISQRGQQKLIKVANELLHQVEVALAQQHYRSAAYIAQSFIEKLTPILSKTETASEIRSIIQTSFQLLEQLITMSIPPDLLDELWQYAITEFQKVTYRLNGIVPAFFQWQRQLATQLQREPELLHQLNEFATQNIQMSDNETRLLIHRMELMDKLGETSQATTLLQQHKDNPELLLFVIQKTFEREAYEQTKQLAEQALTLTLPRELHQQLTGILLSIAKMEDDQAAIALYAEQQLFQTLAAADYDLLKANYQSDWNKKWRNLVERIQRTSFSIERRNLVAHIYATEQAFDALIDYINKLQSLDILQYVAPTLLKSHKEQLATLYQDLMQHYLQHHAGRQASIRIREKLAHLSEAGGRKMARQLATNLRTTFPERHTLLEELAVFG